MIQEYVERRLAKYRIKGIKWDHWKTSKVIVGVEFYPVEYTGNTAFVPTGSKSKPAGVSNLGDCFVLFVDLDEKHKLFYLHIDQLKKYIKDNFNKLKKSMGSEYEHQGVEIGIDDLTSSFGTSLFVDSSLYDHDS